MPLSDANLVQTNSGGFNATSGNATLGAGTTAGNTVLIYCAAGGGILSTPPTGFVRASETPGGSCPMAIWYRSNVPAAETTWSISTSIAGPCSWWVEEWTGLDLTAPVDVVPTGLHATAAASATATSDTTPVSSTYDGLVLAMHAGYMTTTTVPVTFSGQTNGLVEVADVGTSGTGKSMGLAISRTYSQSLAAWQSTATCDTTATNVSAAIVVLSAAGAQRAPNIEVMAGFEWGTATGLATGNAGAAPFDSVAGTPAVITTAPRSGNYCLELSSSAAAENLTWATSGALGLYPPASPTVFVLRASVYFPSSLPAGDVDLLSLENTTAKGAFLRYRTSGTKLGLTVGGTAAGTEQFSGAVVPDAWYDIDLRYDGKTGSSVTLSADWRVDGVALTQATAADTLARVPNTVRLGWNGATTATVRLDDVAVSKITGHYPLGDLKILPLKADPAGTLTISGTTANFQTFTANGTLVAWNATTARTNISELPPTIGASADGFAQITSAASDYVEIPMETYQAAPGESVRAVRVYVPGWSPSATAQAFGLKAWDGTTETALMSPLPSDMNFDNATTTGWVCRMVRVISLAIAYLWNQPKLDALCFRVGYSNVAQDVGIHAIYAEVAVQPSGTAGMFGDASTGRAMLESQTDPVSGGIEGLTLTTTDRPASLTYEESGAPTTVDVARDTVQVEVIDAADASVVNRVELDYSPEGVADT